MLRRTKKPPTKLRLTVILLLLSLLSDALSVPMLYGTTYHFSTIFLILTLVFVGRREAIILALITSCSAYFLFKMPVFDSVIIVFEMIFMASVYKYRRGSVFVNNLLFWLLVSVGFLIGSLYTDIFPSHTELLLHLGKSSVNGSSNALAAEVLFTYLPILFRRLNRGMPEKVPLQQILIHISLSGLVLPFVCFMIMTGISTNHTVNSRALELVQSTSTSIQEQVSNWNSAEYRALELQDIIQLGKLSAIINSIATSTVRVGITDSEGGILIDSSSGSDIDSPMEWSGNYSLYRNNSNLNVALPKGSHFTEISMWDRGFYWYSAPVYEGSDYLIDIRVPASYFLSQVYSVYAIEFGLIIVFMLFVLLFVYWISKFIVKILINLMLETTGLPDKITKDFEVSNKESHILEFDKLYENFQQMANKLKEVFMDAMRMNGILKEQAQQIKQSEMEFQKLAFTDMLTKIPNRLYFHEKLRQLKEVRTTGFTLMFMDLNKFKSINDTYGHEAGDKLLQHAAKLLTSASGADNVFRLGGDEFVIILVTTDLDLVMYTATHILELFNAPLQFQDHTLHPRISIGIASYPQDTENPDELLKLADHAMYRAKESDTFIVWHSDHITKQGDVDGV